MFDFDNCTKYKKDFYTINWQEQKYQGTDFLNFAAINRKDINLNLQLLFLI